MSATKAKRDPAHKLLTKYGWSFEGTNGQGHRSYRWTDQRGIQHHTTMPSGKDDAVNLDKARRRDRKCKQGKCPHAIHHDRREGICQ